MVSGSHSKEEAKAREDEGGDQEGGRAGGLRAVGPPRWLSSADSTFLKCDLPRLGWAGARSEGSL